MKFRCRNRWYGRTRRTNVAIIYYGSTGSLSVETQPEAPILGDVWACDVHANNEVVTDVTLVRMPGHWREHYQLIPGTSPKQYDDLDKKVVVKPVRRLTRGV